MKERKLDFILEEDAKGKKLVFRFYPRGSHMHSFDDKPPKTFQDVYKVYYSWAIIDYSYNYKNNIKVAERVFYMSCDECSALCDLASAIRYMLRHRRKEMDVLSFGQPGSDWKLEYLPRKYDEQGNPNLSYGDGRVYFTVFNNYKHNGYEFCLNVEKTKKFCDYLEAVNQHMLENGEPI